jgi:hypothetical protein
MVIIISTSEKPRILPVAICPSLAEKTSPQFLASKCFTVWFSFAGLGAARLAVAIHAVGPPAAELPLDQTVSSPIV